MPKFATKAADNMFCQARYEAAKFLVLTGQGLHE